MKTCASCRFFVLLKPKSKEGHCHRYPPTLYEIEEYLDASFPRVRIVEWCGEWQLEPARCQHEWENRSTVNLEDENPTGIEYFTCALCGVEKPKEE